jgi:hypothetical protein
MLQPRSNSPVSSTNPWPLGLSRCWKAGQIPTRSIHWSVSLATKTETRERERETIFETNHQTSCLHSLNTMSKTFKLVSLQRTEWASSGEKHQVGHNACPFAASPDTNPSQAVWTRHRNKTTQTLHQNWNTLDLEINESNAWASFPRCPASHQNIEVGNVQIQQCHIPENRQKF